MTEMTPIADIPQTMNETNAAASTVLLLGHTGDWWDLGMIVSLGLAAFVAFFIVAFTAGSVIVHKREAVAATAELERYKLETAGKVAEATKAGVAAGEKAGRAQNSAEAAQVEIEKQKAIAATAQLETERIKAQVLWRSIPLDAAKKMEAVLKHNPGVVNLRFTDGDPEALFLAIQISQIFAKANWQVAPGSVKFGNALVFDFALPDSNSRDAQTLRRSFTEAGLRFSPDPLPPAGASFNITTIPGAPTLMVGSKRPPVFP